MTTFFVSDTHFGCDKLVANTRTEFSDIKQHDDHLMDVLNSTVMPNDMLVILGDWCKEKPGRYRQKLRCKHNFFILGNHDKEKKIRAVFGGNVWNQKMVKVGTQRVWCSHYPTAFWDRSHYGVYHAYGHLHDNREREMMMDKGMPGRRSMDVGVDHARRVLGEWKPWSAQMFFAMLGASSGHDIIKKEERWNAKDYS